LRGQLSVDAYKCYVCFPQRHQRNFWDQRCTKDIVTDVDDDTAEVADAAAAAPAPVVAPVPTIVVAELAIHELARRNTNPLHQQRQERARYVILQSACDAALRQSRNARNLIRVQRAWEAYVQKVKDLCSDEFWKFFLSVHRHSGAFIDSALAGVKRAFDPDASAGQFPSRRIRLLASIRTLPSFWSSVMHTFDIDLSDFRGLQTKSIRFKFIDPMWAWLFVAARLDPLDLHWRPAVQSHPPPAMYGAGVQYGKAFRAAYRSCPLGAFAMLMSLHWDGTHAHGQESAPIVIGVCNTNCSGGEATQFCIAYVPKLPKVDATPEFVKTAKATKIKHYIRQQCAHAILRVMASAALNGVQVVLRNQLGVHVRRLLFPRLYAMNFDQPEAQNFFGLQNRCCCTKCRRRKGFSGFRCKCCRHCRKQIQRLYAIAKDAASPFKDIARAKLTRWGFNWERECCLLDENLANLLITFIGNSRDVFPCVDYRDRMHGLFIFLHRSVKETLNLIPLTAAQKRLLDTRLRIVSSRCTFRDSQNKAYRLQRSIFSDTNTTAVDKVCILFLLPAVLGHRAEIIPRFVREQLLTAIAYSQLLIIAARGNRAYTANELDQIFNVGWVIIFGALQSVVNAVHQRQQSLHQQNPDGFDMPKPIKLRQKDEAASATEDTEDESNIGGRGRFSHGDLALVHQHWVESVISAGCFSAHCTEAAEAYHKLCMRR